MDMSDNARLSGEVLLDVGSPEEYRAAVLRFLGDALGRVEVLLKARVEELADGSAGRVHGDALTGRIKLSAASLELGGMYQHRPYSPENLAWLAERAAEGRSVSAVAGVVGQGGIHVDLVCTLRAWRDDADDRWAVLRMETPDSGALVDSIRTLAEQVDPVFGSIGHGGDMTCTELERALGLRDLGDTYDDARRILRGYDWITVVPRQLAAEHGGAAAFAGSALSTVDELPSGALWLAATEEFADYRGSAVWAMFEAVAPMLPTGLPAQREWLGVPSQVSPVVLEDAEKYGATRAFDS
ncbi:hypothetical protein TR51_14195 [Kitasatospora griseola]|uniref:DUF3396 domain-containing protein n=2 Tax=Kitasatospora griseola TaxID=2064 RepID=A0A0D0P0V2_KITGR|nr:hypothetical protein TR51_14195 [Kitasatospora griseola]